MKKTTEASGSTEEGRAGPGHSVCGLHVLLLPITSGSGRSLHVGSCRLLVRNPKVGLFPGRGLSVRVIGG